jgi:drug/metabolite transporter (DMT)-like permease
MTSSTNTKYIVGALLIFIGAVMFAGKAVIVKWLYIHHPIDTVSLLALRMLFSLPFYIVILVWNKWKYPSDIRLTQKEWAWMLAIGLLGYYLASFFDFWGLQYISAGLERLVLFIYPTLVLIISAIFFKKNILKIQYIALIITYLGIVLAFVPEIKMGMQKNLLLGAFLIFLSALTYALYLIGNGEMVKKIGTTLFTCYAMLISTAMVIVHYLITSKTNLMHYEPVVYQQSMVMAVFCTVIPSFLVSEGIQRVGSGNAAIIGSIGPMATIFMATYFLNETFNNWQIAGTLFILIGVLMISVKKKH